MAFDWEAEERFLNEYPANYVSLRRTWRERLLSRPWKPWETHRTVVVDPYASRRIRVAFRKVQVRLVESFRQVTPAYEYFSGLAQRAEPDVRP